MAWLHPSPTANAATPSPHIRGKSWLQPSATSTSKPQPRSEGSAWLQPSPSSGSTALGDGIEHIGGRRWKRARTTMAPSSSVWRLQTCAASGSRGVQRPASSLGGQSWLRPSASSDSTSQGAEPKRCRVDARLPETVSKLERKIYLDMAAVMMATETTNKENSFRRWHVGTRRIADALAVPCCTTAASLYQHH